MFATGDRPGPRNCPGAISCQDGRGRAGGRGGDKREQSTLYRGKCGYVARVADRVIDQPRPPSTAVGDDGCDPCANDEDGACPSRVRTCDKLDAEALRVVIDIERDRFVVLRRGLSIV